MTGTRRNSADVGSLSPSGRRWVKWRSVAALVLWTLLVWVGRLRNVMADEALDAEGRWLRLALAVSFVLPALLIAFGIIAVLRQTNAQSAVTSAVGLLAVGLSVWTICVWVVRGLDIVLDGSYDAGFRLIHSILAVVSIALAGWVISRR